MNALHMAELRGSWRAWLSVSIAFIVTSFALSACALLYVSTNRAAAAGRLDENSAMGMQALFILNVVLAALVGVGVLSSAAQLVVSSRRGAIARLALAGASPAQIRGTLTSQLVLVSLVSGVVGGILAVVLQGPLHWWYGQAGDGDLGGVLDPVFSPVPLLVAILGVIAVAVLAGVPVAIRATQIPPVEALRQAASEPIERVPTRTKVVFGLFVIVIIAVSALSYVLFSMNDFQKGDQIVAFALFLMIMVGLALQQGAPLLMGPLTRVWTSLVRTQSPAWQLARHQVLARSIRLVRTVVPVMFAVGVSAGMLVIGGAMEKVLALKFGDDQVGGNQSTIAALITMAGMAFLVALSGSIGNLLMMARQRDAELALAGISGATEDQQRAIVTFEGAIIGGTAVLLGLIMGAVTAIYVNVAFIVFEGYSAWSIPWAQLLAVIVAVIAICVITTVLPALPTLRQPPQKVVARLIAD